MSEPGQSQGATIAFMGRRLSHPQGIRHAICSVGSEPFGTHTRQQNTMPWCDRLEQWTPIHNPVVDHPISRIVLTGAHANAGTRASPTVVPGFVPSSSFTWSFSRRGKLTGGRTQETKPTDNGSRAQMSPRLGLCRLKHDRLLNLALDW